ncbi:hypothetical protein KUTeg_018678 [Tegillarca granosa]|uniref:Uncharacterized protein n=1 Tax=Tegillarca granosa TaxID=220873 RepID=A0ABQ9EF00_TEGGR|nr:hypothetical protein KUTeg_018678 [Tegillarca granosa]
MPPKRKPSKKADGILKKKRKTNATEPGDAGVIRQGNRSSPGQAGAVLQAPCASTSAIPDVVWCADGVITAHILAVLNLQISILPVILYRMSLAVKNPGQRNIYLRRYPERAVELTQYMSVIRGAAAWSPGFGWRAYDEQFRLRQATQYQSWTTLNYPLWLSLLSVPRNSDKNRLWVSNADIQLSTDSSAKVGLLQRLMRQFITFTDGQISQAFSLCGHAPNTRAGLVMDGLQSELRR